MLCTCALNAVCMCCRLELEQERKWVVENQVDQQELVVTVKDPKHSVYIYNCSGSVVQVGAHTGWHILGGISQGGRRISTPHLGA